MYALHVNIFETLISASVRSFDNFVKGGGIIIISQAYAILIIKI